MKPYFQDQLLTVYHGDCREILPTLNADLLIADPPYEETNIVWDRWPEGWVEAAAGCSFSMWCFGSMRMFMEHGQELKIWKMSQDLVWEKHNGTGLHNDRFRKVHELMLHFYRGEWSAVHHVPVLTHDAVKRTIRRKGKPQHWGDVGGSTFTSEDGGPRLARSVIYCRNSHGHAIHPTQKPKGILRPLIEYGCPQGGAIVDCFMGSGSSLQVARDLGISAVGIEIDEAICERAVLELTQQPTFL